jgi:hypothetical protein
MFYACLHCIAQFSSYYQNAEILLVSYIGVAVAREALIFLEKKWMSTFLWMWRVFLESLVAFARTVFKRIVNRRTDIFLYIYRLLAGIPAAKRLRCTYLISISSFLAVQETHTIFALTHDTTF